MIKAIQTQRIHSIDALRGFALAGVALVHFVEQYIAGPSPEGFMTDINGLPDQIIQGFLQLFFTGKFFALFSILFGLSFSIQMQSAADKNIKFEGRFIWRAALLFGIGYIHQIFYRGDILTIYAVLAPFIIPFYRMSNKWLLIIAGIVFLGVPRFIAFSLFGTESVTGIHSVMDNNNEFIIHYFNIIQNGSLWDVFKINASYGMMTKIDFQVSLFGRLYYTFGYFLIGIWLGKIGVFNQLAVHLKKIKTFMLWSIVGLLLSFVATLTTFATMAQPVDNGSWQFVFGMNFMDWFNVSLSSIILCGFLLLYQKDSWKRKLLFFAPYGRMALTNYVFQSVIGTYILFGWGLGYLGQIRTSVLFIMALLLIFLQTTISKYWLRTFKYGPLEWLWRCGTYLKWQPFLNEKTPVAPYTSGAD